jgi:hypothetical protein
MNPTTTNTAAIPKNGVEPTRYVQFSAQYHENEASADDAEKQLETAFY